MVRRLLEVDWNAPAMVAFDWALALASLTVGIWLESVVWIAGGAVGVLVAWWRPMARLRVALDGMIVRRMAMTDEGERR